MAKPFHELRERLLCAGVAPRYVRRYLAELEDHFRDLTAEEVHAGRSREEAESAALTRLGGTDGLYKAMVEQRQFQSWCARAPWATFSLGPLFLLAGAYLVACIYLWWGWRAFLPDADTPFGVRNAGSIFALQNIYFQAGRLYYFAAPVLVGWGIGLLAARQRLKPTWPVVGLAMLAWTGATARIHASLTGVTGGLGHVSMNFLTVGSTGEAVAGNVLHALVIFMLTVLPYLIWRLLKAHAVST